VDAPAAHAERRVNIPIITVLTSNPSHATLRALVISGASEGVAIRCASRVESNSALVFQWSYARPRALAAVRQYCAHHRIEHVNAEPLSKWDQLVRLVDAEVPVPDSRRASSLSAACEAAVLLRYPVVIKPNWGLKSQGVELVQNEAQLAEKWTPSHRVVQSYLPEGGRCTRILVIGDRALSAITRVANDGFHATYDHGQRGTLEPFTRLAERESLAVAACRAVGVAVGGVDLVETAYGPRILEVNHIRVEFGDRELHGPHAVTSLATWLAARARLRVETAPKPEVARVRIVTRDPADATLDHLTQACRVAGLEPEVATTVDPTVGATWFWGVSDLQHRRGAAQLRALSMPVVNGHAASLWRDRAKLFRSGIAVPRSRLVHGFDQSLSIARELGYPLTLRRRSARGTVVISNEKELSDYWSRDNAHCLIEPAHYLTAPRLRVFVVGERAYFAKRLTKRGARHVPLRLAPCELAIAACRVLGVDSGFVDVLLVDGEPVVRRVVPRSRFIARLRPVNARAALHELTTLLRTRLASTPAARSRPSTGVKRLTLLLVRPDDKARGDHRIGNIQALQRELLRRGHRVLTLEHGFDRQRIDNADLILQDPLHAFGLGRRGDELDNLLFEHAASRCHLLRRARSGSVDKRAMHALALALGVRVPEIFEHHRVTPAHLPLIAKPRRGSLGIGVRRIGSLRELSRLQKGMVLQQLIDARTPSVVSIRAVTVVDRVVAAALFHNDQSICSNLSQGGRAIPLTGPGRGLHLTHLEQALLERVGIDPRRREVPEEVSTMAGILGRHHATRGAQMLGQDFVVDAEHRWYFLEVNLGFGTAIFNATDGEGFPSSGRGLVHAGRVLADAVEQRFARGGERIA
jgi:glutathione synthase/RimK-type ligase-like ATP-grasp enzyme